MKKLFLLMFLFSVSFAVGLFVFSPPCTQEAPHPIAVAKKDAVLLRLSHDTLDEKQTKILDRIKKHKTAVETIVTRLDPSVLGVMPLGIQLNEHTKLVIDKYEYKVETDGVERQVDPNTKAKVHYINWKAGTDSVMLLVSNNDQYATGLIYAENKVFSVSPLGGGLHAVTHIDQTKFPKD